MYFLVIYVSMAAALQGMDESVTNGANLFWAPQFGLITTRGYPNAANNQWYLGLTNGAPYLAYAVLGCWLTAPVNNYLGRRGAMFLGSLISFLGCIWSGCTNSWNHLLAPVSSVASVSAQTLRLFPSSLSNDTGCISGALIMPDFEERFGVLQDDGNYALGSSRESLVVSFLSIGTIIGAVLQSFSTDWIGRKWSILLWSTIFTIGSVIQTASFWSIWQLLVGRLVAGMGVGAMSALVTLFAGEVAPTRLRGKMLTLYSVMNGVGIVLSYLVSLGSSNLSSSASWRIPVGLQIPFGLALCIGIFFIPESPRRLLYLGKNEEARKALAFINGVPEQSGQVDELMVEIKDGIAKENEGGAAGWRDCFGKEIRSRMMHGIVLQTLQQFSGQNYYYYYGASFFSQSGTGLNGFEVQACMGVIAFLSVCVALYTIDHLGRRKALMSGAAGQAMCAVVVAIVGKIMLAPSGTPVDQLTEKNKTGGAIVVAFALLHLAFYGSLSGSVPWTVLG
ncbi:hypothetical protein JCM8547_009180 [Rhodosporidiobolus lusitaniae]